MMKQQVTTVIQPLTSSRGLALVVLVVLGLVSIMPGWVRAQSDPNATTSTFTSPLPGPPHDHHDGPGDDFRELLETIVDRDALLADVLGITVDELDTARADGLSLAELMDQAGLDAETVRTELQSAVAEAVQQAVTDGVITQEQADVLLNPPAPPQHNNGHNDHHGSADDADEETAPPSGAATATPASTPEGMTDAPDTTIGGGPDHHHPRHERRDVPTSEADESNPVGDSSASDDGAASAPTESSASDERPADASSNPAGGHRRPRR
ncbi:MAG: hypothetical protein R3E79_20290 [Caldilineaceae bacterium]